MTAEQETTSNVQARVASDGLSDPPAHRLRSPASPHLPRRLPSTPCPHQPRGCPRPCTAWAGSSVRPLPAPTPATWTALRKAPAPRGQAALPGPWSRDHGLRGKPVCRRLPLACSTDHGLRERPVPWAPRVLLSCSREALGPHPRDRPHSGRPEPQGPGLSRPRLSAAFTNCLGAFPG